jgi:ribosomal protein L20A (L18A)
MDLSGKHRVRRKDVAIIRTTVITKKENVRRKKI